MSILVGLFAILILGLVPMVLYALILWWFDRYEKEPALLLAIAFLWGAIPAILFSLVFEIAADYPVNYFLDEPTANVVGAAVVAPIVEEMFKSSVLWYWLLVDIVRRLLRRWIPQIFEENAWRIVLWILLPPFFEEFDSAVDGIIYGGVVGFGFAAVENVLYFFGTYTQGGLGNVLILAFLRAFVFGLNHAMFTGFAGLGLALARNTRNWIVRIGAPLLGLGMGMFAHAVHNGSVSFADQGWPCLITFTSAFGGVLFLLAIILWATFRERRWIVDNLAEEVSLGTLSQLDYEVACSYFKRVGVRANMLFHGDLRRWWLLGRYYRLATELAFGKRRLAMFPGDRECEERVARLRGQVRGLGDQVA